MFDEIHARRRWTLETVHGPAGPVLIEACASAELLVVGTRRLQDLSRVLDGSVSEYSLRHAPCPLAVVPAPEGAAVPSRSAPCRCQDVTGLESGRVVVGLPDGGPAYINALLDAAAVLYRQRNTSTTRVHAIGSAHSRRRSSDEVITERHRSRQLLHGAARQLASRVGYRARIETSSSTTTPVDELVNQSHAASLLILLHGSTPQHDRAMTASVTTEVTARAACPVLVLQAGCPVPASGPVVVGISAARSSIVAIAAAFDEASWRGCELVAVHAWARPDLTLWSQAVLPGRPAIEAYQQVVALTRQRAVIDVAEALAGQSDRFPEVTVQHVLDTASPVEAMMRATTGAQLIVVSRHHRATHHTKGLGMVARRLLHHSDCPVMITPSAIEPLVTDPPPTHAEMVTPVMTGMAPRW